MNRRPPSVPPAPLFQPTPLGLRPGAGLDRWAFAAVVALAVAGAAFSLLAPLAHLTFRSSDDSYYYFGVARHLVLGHGFTFDGIHQTNGFHPLWLACLTPLFALGGGDAELSLRLAFVLVALVGAATFWMAYVCLTTYAGRGAGLLGMAALTAPPFLNPIVCGLETGLLLLLLFHFLWAVRRFDLLSLAAPPRRNAALGMLLALLAMTRLDQVFVVLAVFAVLVARWARRAEGPLPVGVLAGKLLQVGAVFSLAIAPYFLWNWMSFGHLVPISGALKTSFPVVKPSLPHLRTYHARYGQGLLLAGTAALVWLAWLRAWTRRRDPGPARRGAPPALHPVVVAAWAGCALHMAYTALFMGFGMHWWHFAAYIPMALVAVAGAGATVLGRWPRALVGGLAGGLLALSGLAHVADARFRGAEHEIWLEAALWSRANLPPGAVVGMTDCGLFGYLSGRPTVNLDGLINGYEYQEALHRRQLRRFFAASRVTHIAVSAAAYHEGAHFLWLPARLHRGFGAAVIGLESAEVYRSARVFRGRPFVLWELARLPVYDDGLDPAALAYRKPR